MKGKIPAAALSCLVMVTAGAEKPVHAALTPPDARVLENRFLRKPPALPGFRLTDTLYGCTRDLHLVGVTVTLNVVFSTAQQRSDVAPHVRELKKSLLRLWQQHTGAGRAAEFLEFSSKAEPYAAQAGTDISLLLAPLPVRSRRIEVQDFVLSQKADFRRCRLSLT